MMSPEGAYGNDPGLDEDNNSSEPEENGSVPELEIDKEFQIPEDAKEIQG